MLTSEELENIAKLNRLSLINIEKDYLQNLVLFSIYSHIGNELVFKGGTCLYKIYKLNRFSEDLDFTLVKEIDTKKVAGRIISDLALLNIKSKIKEIKEYKKEVNIRLLLNGPLYKGSKETQCFIPLNISKKEQVLSESRREIIIPMYRDIPTFEVFVMQEEEILAEKVRAIFTRLKPRDIYDLWFLLTKKNIAPNLQLINKKLALYNLKFNLEDFKKRVEKMRGLWRIDLRDIVIGELQIFDSIKKELFERLERAF